MKHFLCVILAVMLLCLTACSEYAEPDIDTLIADILASQQFEADMTSADDSTIQMLFDFAENADGSGFSYSGKGGLADMIAVFKMKDSDSAAAAMHALSDYKSERYDDYKGYAPMEAKKIEDGKIYVYEKYVILMVVPDIPTAESVMEAAFKA